MPINHKHLLEKYIDHITQCERIDFVSYDNTAHVCRSDVDFTSEEVEFFRRTRRMLDEHQAPPRAGRAK